MKKKFYYLLTFTFILLMGCQKLQIKKNLTNKKLYPKPDKLCALTFDDGPDVVKTPLVLEKLKKYNVKATFFMVGQNINEKTKPIIVRIVNMGNEIGNHSFTYEGIDKFDEAKVKEYVSKTSKLIKKYSGQEPKFFRAPNLAASSTMYKVIDMPFASGVLGFDWAGQNTSAEDRANNVLKDMQDGAIILLHDVQPFPHPTPEALDILIPKLKRQGYEFVTLSELFKRKHIKFKPHEEKMWKYVK